MPALAPVSLRPTPAMPATGASQAATTATVRPGDQGPAVANLQRLLTSKGVYSGTADGKYGPATRAAVAAFQEQAGLRADGICGPQTWSALRGGTSSGSGSTPVGPVGSVPGFSSTQLGYVRTMVQQARAAGVPPELPVMTALVETRLQNLNHGDRDSVGLFQQRNAWGSFADRTNVEKATRMFLYGGKEGQRGAVAFKARFGSNPSADALGRWAQAVQVSAFPDRYAREYSLARRLVAASGA